jgi:hypothetical protein
VYQEYYNKIKLIKKNFDEKTGLIDIKWKVKGNKN